MGAIPNRFFREEDYFFVIRNAAKKADGSIWNWRVAFNQIMIVFGKRLSVYQ